VSTKSLRLEVNTKADSYHITTNRRTAFLWRKRLRVDHNFPTIFGCGILSRSEKFCGNLSKIYVGNYMKWRYLCFW